MFGLNSKFTIVKASIWGLLQIWQGDQRLVWSNRYGAEGRADSIWL